MLSSLLVSSLIGLGAAVAAGYEIRLSNASDLLNFASEVNQGVLHIGATVVLDSDIDFSGELSQQFEPIGKNLTNYFAGTFDGQGHVIRNLTATTSSKYAGLFGYSKGVVIRNLVIDSSCSFTSTSNFTGAYVGGVIGECYANDDNCTFENSVNMGAPPSAGTSMMNLCTSGALLGMSTLRSKVPTPRTALTTVLSQTGELALACISAASLGSPSK